MATAKKKAPVPADSAEETAPTGPEEAASPMEERAAGFFVDTETHARVRTLLGQLPALGLGYAGVEMVDELRVLLQVHPPAE